MSGTQHNDNRISEAVDCKDTSVKNGEVRAGLNQLQNAGTSPPGETIKSSRQLEVTEDLRQYVAQVMNGSNPHIFSAEAIAESDLFTFIHLRVEHDDIESVSESEDLIAAGDNESFGFTAPETSAVADTDLYKASVTVAVDSAHGLSGSSSDDRPAPQGDAADNLIVRSRPPKADCEGVIRPVTTPPVSESKVSPLVEPTAAPWQVPGPIDYSVGRDLVCVVPNGGMPYSFGVVSNQMVTIARYYPLGPAPNRAYLFSWIVRPTFREIGVPTGLTYRSLWLRVSPDNEPGIVYSAATAPYSVAYAGLLADTGGRGCILLWVGDVDGHDLYWAPDQVVAPFSSASSTIDLVLRFQGATMGYSGSGNFEVSGGSFRLADVAAVPPQVTLSMQSSSGGPSFVQPVELVGSNTSNPVWISSNQPSPAPPYVPPGTAPSHQEMHAYNGNTTRLRAEAGEWVPRDEENYLPPGCREWVDMTETEEYRAFIGQPTESKRDGDETQIVVTSPVPDLDGDRITAVFSNPLAAAVSRFIFGVVSHNIWNDLPLDESDALDDELGALPPLSVLVPAAVPPAQTGPPLPATATHPPGPPPAPKANPKTPPPSPKLESKTGPDLLNRGKAL